jgi:hypothetical protein
MFAALLAASLLFQTPNRAGATGPTLVITYPTAKVSATNAAITVSGTTKDKVAVTNVMCQLNGAATPADTTNAWTNWTASVALTPGTNIVAAYAEDKDGDKSKTDTVKFIYALPAPLSVKVASIGTVIPGTWTTKNKGEYDIGIQYSLTAKPDKGFAFVNWSGSFPTNKATLTFVMASNLVLTANFADIQPPVCVITYPAVGHTVSSSPINAMVRASDNVGVAAVYYQLLPGGSWQSDATSTDGTNWTVANLALTPGANTLSAYAEDAAGNRSKTNKVSFKYESSTGGGGDLAPTSLSGMSAVVTSADGSETFTITFGASTFSQTMLPGGNESDNSVGNYSYKVKSPNTAQLTVSATAPPDNTGSTVVGLTFTNTNEAVYSTSGNGSGSTGTILLSKAQDLAPTSLAGDTVDLVDFTSGDHLTTVFASSSLTNTDQTTGEVSAGSYTFKQYSPTAGLATIHFASLNGYKNVVAYYITTFSASDAGTWFAAFVTSRGSETHVGTFTVP